MTASIRADWDGEEGFECRISGMDCPDCAAKIEKVARKVPGASDVRVDFARETLSARVESEQARERLRASVHSLGYRMAGQADKTRSAFRIENMDCPDEKHLVEKALQGLQGLLDFDVNLVMRQLNVIHEPETLPVSRLIEVLGEAGLKAVPLGASREIEGFWSGHAHLLSTVVAGFFTATGLILHQLQIDGGGEKIAYTLAIVSGGWLVARKGIAAIRHAVLDMNFLMSIAVIGALFIGAWDEAAMVVFLFALSQTLESRAMDRARDAVRTLMDLTPPVARVLDDGIEVIRPVADVHTDDLIRIGPDARVPLDGVVVRGESAINQAPITGESIPVDKLPGDVVYAGSINGPGSLDVRVTHSAADTTLARIIHLVEEAQATRSPAQTFVDRFARVYTPAVLLIAGLVATLPTLVFSQPFDVWFYRALVLLVIACPCALVISTPVAITTGLARGARDGVLIKGGLHLENVGRLKALAFDKTGTLTEGRPRVTDVVTLDNVSSDQLTRIAASLESLSGHPLAQAICTHAQEAGIEIETVDNFESLTGRGVVGRIGEHRYILGNHRLFEERGLCTPEIDAVMESHQEEGKTTVMVGSQDRVLGLIAIADRPRREAREVVSRLHALGIRPIVMLTGDNRQTARTIARQLDIDDAKAELLPQDKVAAVRELAAVSQNVGMVGDGVNDAPAMAAATIGVAMGAAGSDAALEIADLVLMGDDLRRLPFAIRLSRATLRAIRQNIGIAIGLKAIFLVLAVPGYATLWMAVIADMGASLIVIGNSLRLLWIRSDGAKAASIAPD